MNEIEREYQDKAARTGDPPILTADIAMEFIDSCIERGVEVFGFDGFLIMPEGELRPSMEDMLDFDWKDLRDLSYGEKIEKAKKMISARLGTAVVFEVVSEDRPE